MNACNQCTDTNKVPTCVAFLIIGEAQASTDYWVYVKNNATGYQERQEFTTGDDKLVKLDMSNPYADLYTENFYYTIWVTEVDAIMSDHIPITIDSVEYDCFTTIFERVFSEDEPAEFTTYSLSV